MASRVQRLTASILALGTLVGCGSTTTPKGHSGAGTEFTFRVSTGASATVTRAELQSAAQIMRDRVAKLGATGRVSIRGPREIVVRVDGLPAEPTGTTIGAGGQLDLYDFAPALVPPSVNAARDSSQPYTNLFDLLSAVQSRIGTGTPSGYVLFKPDKSVARGGIGTGEAATHVPKGWKQLKIPPKTVIVTCDAKSSSVCPAQNQGALPPNGGEFYYLFKHGSYPGDRYASDGRYPNMTGSDLQLPSVRPDFDPNGQPIVIMAFTARGNRAFEQVSLNEARRGYLSGTGSTCGDTCAFAIVLDNKIRSYPTIDPTQNPQGIDPTGTGVQITFGAGTSAVSDAKQLAVVLQTGALPERFVLVSTRSVSG